MDFLVPHLAPLLGGVPAPAFNGFTDVLTGSNNTSFSWSGVDIGAGAANRRVMMLIGLKGGSASAPTDITIGSYIESDPEYEDEYTRYHTSFGDDSSIIFGLWHIPTSDTSLDVTVTTGGYTEQIAVGIYNLFLTSTTPNTYQTVFSSESSFDHGDGSVNITSDAGGGVGFLNCCADGNTNPNWLSTGSPTQDYNSTWHAMARYIFSGAETRGFSSNGGGGGGTRGGVYVPFSA